MQIIDDGPIVSDYRDAPQSHWTGTYESSGRYQSTKLDSLFLKRIEISEARGGGLTVRAWAAVKSDNRFPVEVAMEATGEEYRDCNFESMNDTVVVSFEKAKYKPLIVLTRGTPFSPRINEQYQYLLYTCYLHGYRGNTYATGRVDRQEMKSTLKSSPIPAPPSTTEKH